MKIGTIGTGPIVDLFLSGIAESESAQCEAVYSRKEATGRVLADKYSIGKVYTDLDCMLNDETINFIYVASPNSLHYEHALKALQKGKNVICEKPFTSTVAEIESLITLAKDKNLMLFEAISILYFPNYQLITEHLHKLGNIKMVQCNYSQYSSKYGQLLAGETPNIFNPKFSGGALQDINIYNLHFIMKMFGSPESVSYTANKHPNGIDTSGVLLLTYPNFICTCVGCKDTQSMSFVQIQGEKGYILVEKGANFCSQVFVHVGNEKICINEQSNSNRMSYEIAAFTEMYHNQDFKRCYNLLDYSYSVMKAVVAARKTANIVFDADLMDA